VIFLGGMLQGVWGKNGDDGGLYILYPHTHPKNYGWERFYDLVRFVAIISIAALVESLVHGRSLIFGWEGTTSAVQRGNFH
jgi:hypothetical protein